MSGAQGNRADTFWSPANHTEESEQVARLNRLRLFEVKGDDGTWTQVVAHWHDGSSGTLYFVTLKADGRKWITDMFPLGTWKHLREVQLHGSTAPGSTRIN